MLSAAHPASWNFPLILRQLGLTALGVSALAAAQEAGPPPPTLPGPQPDGTVLLPSGWSLAPHGEQRALELDLPIRMLPQPGGALLAVQHAGYREHAVVLVGAADLAQVARLDVPRTWSGMAWSADGARLFVSGGVDDVVYGFDAADGFAAAATIAVGDPNQLDLVAGMCSDTEGRLWVCLQRTHRLLRLAADGTVELDLALAPDSFPFECALSGDGARLFVSLWGRAQLACFDARTGAALGAVDVGAHPSALLMHPDGRRLFVSHANENTVGVIDVAALRVTETLSSALYPLAPPGSTPNALALDPSGELLFVANADNNDLAVIEVEAPGRARSLGFIPVGQYPTAVHVTADGRVVVANGKGSRGSAPNPRGPQPEVGHVRDVDHYSGALFRGSLSVFPLPELDPAGAAQLRGLTATAYRCSPLRADGGVTAPRPEDSPIPARVGDPSPIRHCVYIIKENRTYDQVLGDLPEGNGDAALCLFPDAVTPNHHALVRTFVLLDNFYVESEVSADGHEWTMGGYATDFVERTWPVTYGSKGDAKQADGESAGLGYPAEGGFDIAEPSNGYLFDAAARAGVSYRSYGEFVENGAQPGDPGTAAIAALEGRFDPLYRGYDLGYRDVDRVARFKVELAQFEAQGELPQLIVLRLPNDHTWGTRAGKRTPRAMVADNDLALGQIMEALSRSSFWPTMSVFVVEDDAQNGPDHVDAHRTVALVAGPYVRRGAVVSAMYSTCSMLRTMELILGLEPLSQFDVAARPMYECFMGAPDLSPFEARAATWPLDELNAKTAYGAAASERMDLSREDAADDLALNEVVWRSVKGADAPMPPPRRAAFVLALEGDEDDD